MKNLKTAIILLCLLFCWGNNIYAQKFILGGSNVFDYHRILLDPKTYNYTKLCDIKPLFTNDALINDDDSLFYDGNCHEFDFGSCTFKKDTIFRHSNFVYNFSYNFFSSSAFPPINSIYSRNLRTKQEKYLGKLPYAPIVAALYMYNHELYTRNVANLLHKIDTVNMANSIALAKLPIELSANSLLGPLIIEDCDSSQMLFLRYGQYDSLYTEYDFFLCDNMDIVPYSFKQVLTKQLPDVSVDYFTPTLNRLSCIDLDRNNSTTAQTTATRKDYKTVMCGKQSVVCDDDIKLKTRPGFADSLRVWLSDNPDGAAEKIMLTGTLPTGVTLKSTPKSMTFYFPAVMGEPKIEQLIKQIRYENTSVLPTYGTRKVNFYLYASRLVSDPAVAYIEVRKPDSTSAAQQGCAGQNIVVQGNAYSKDTVLNLVSPNRFGCDSLHKVTLAFKAILQGSNKQTICNNTSYSFGNQILTTSGIYTKTEKTNAGCDSTTTLTLTVLPKKSSTISQTICDGNTFLFNNLTLKTSGIYTKTEKTNAGCDSTTTLTLTVLPKKASTISQTICDGNTFLFNNLNLKTSGIYTKTEKTSTGCDSTTTLTLTVLPKKSSTISQTICDGNSFLFNNQTLAASGIYTKTEKTSVGCDSTTTLTLTVLPKKASIISQTICDGNTFLFNNLTLKTSGIYIKTEKTSAGCDSTTTLTLTVLPKKVSTISQTICDGNTFLFNNLNLKTSGIYIKTEKTSAGCDSTTTLTLKVVPLPKITTENVVKIKRGDAQVLTLKVQSNEVYKVDWQPNTYLNKNDTTVVVCTPQEAIKYKIVVSTANNCSSETTIVIEVENGNKVYIPTAFSPNGDGINDTWEVYSDDSSLDIVSVKVYNRLGGLVHDSITPWLAESAIADIYTYVIVLKVNEKTEVYKGDVMVVR